MTASARCNPAASMCCRATRPGPCRAKPGSNWSFPAVTYYDGQGFFIRKSRNAGTSALELDNAKVCVQTGTTTELNLVDYFRANNMRLADVTFENSAGRGECLRCRPLRRLYQRRLPASCRTAQPRKPDDHVILPDMISKEPLGPAVRQGDEHWANIVKWTVFAMINAEELGVASASVDQALQSEPARKSSGWSAPTATSASRWG